MSENTKSLNFLEQIIEEDLAGGMLANSLRFRFPPEPNGYLHIGHTKAIGISFGLGEKYGAPVNLRFDDTNPAKEEQATDRAYRIGQTRDVYVHYPMAVAEDFATFDTVIHQLLFNKRQLSEAALYPTIAAEVTKNELFDKVMEAVA